MSDNPHGAADGFIHLVDQFALDVPKLKRETAGLPKLTMESFAEEAGKLALRVRNSGLCPGCATMLEGQVGMAIIQHDQHEQATQMASDVASRQDNMPKEPTHPGSERKQ